VLAQGQTSVTAYVPLNQMWYNWYLLDANTTTDANPRTIYGRGRNVVINAPIDYVPVRKAG